MSDILNGNNNLAPVKNYFTAGRSKVKDRKGRKVEGSERAGMGEREEGGRNLSAKKSFRARANDVRHRGIW